MRKGTAAIIILLVSVLFSACGNSSQEILLNRDESFFSDFHVEDGFVYLECYISVSNKNKSDIEFEIYVDYADDVKTGLLKESTLFVCENIVDNQIYLINAGATEKFYCTFVGEYAGTLIKHDRNLPENITLMLLKDKSVQLKHFPNKAENYSGKSVFIYCEWSCFII